MDSPIDHSDHMCFDCLYLQGRLDNTEQDVRVLKQQLQRLSLQLTFLQKRIVDHSIDLLDPNGDLISQDR